ncbi:armadillo-type protein [Chytriomyces cf. hyalinus JEL632]|nr:armadillo-type protein [Chytriomyces cf. hyalinus JEL632]
MLVGKHGFMPNLVLSTIRNNEKLVDGSDSTAIQYALVLGEALGCLVYKKWDLAHVASLKDQVAKYFEKNLIAGSAKSAVSKTVLSSFDLFFKQFLTAEMLQNQLRMSAERLMLRSPEFILRIFQSIIKPVAFGLSQLFREKFVDSLLNNMKSTNEAIRADAASLFETFASKSSNGDDLLKVAHVVLKAFTGASFFLARNTSIVLFNSASFPAVTPAISGKIISALIPLTAKETSETSLLACFAALAAHSEAYLATSDSSILTQLVTFIASGLTDVKSSDLIRKSILGLLNKASFEALSTCLAEKSLLGVYDQLAFFHCLSLILTTESLYAMLPSASRQEKSLFASAWAHLMSPSVNHEVRRAAINYIQTLVCTASPDQEEILQRVANIGRMGIGAIVEKSVVLDRPNPSSLTSNSEVSNAISVAAAAEASAWGDDVAKQQSELSALSPVEASEEDYTLGGFSVNVSAGFQEAALNAIILLVGVFPEVVLNKAMPSILESLDNGVVKNVTLLIIFASEILISHCGLGGSPLVRRRSMVHVLIKLLNTLPRLHGAAREGLLTLCVSMEDSAADEEDEDPETLDESEKLLKKMLATDEVDISNELLDALLSSEPMARQSALRALQHMPMPAGAADGVAAARVWAAKYDADEEIAAEAGRVWEMWNAESSLDANGIQGVVDLICDPCGEIRAAAGKSLSAALSTLNNHTIPVMKQLFNVVPMPEYDDFAIVIPESLEKKDEWPARSGIALALQSYREESVRLEMLEAGFAAVNTDTGKSLVNPLLKTFSEYLAQPAGSSKTHDLIRESAVIVLLTVAQHLDASDKKIPEVVDRLVETLKTPSEVVQMAVSECLPPLVKSCLRQCAAYSIAGTVKGRGISPLKEYGVMSSLKDAVEGKKKMERREGALFAFEALSMTLGRLFEPYVIQILPLLLVCYGDSQREVRDATNDAFKAIMSKRSGHCVKLVMPSLLNGLDD